MLTVSDLQNAAESIQFYCQDKLGYSRVTSPHFEVRPDQDLKFWITLYDDFQNSLPHAWQERQGTQYFEGTLDEIWAQLAGLPSRRTREISCLCRQVGASAEMLENLQDAKAQDFARDLIRARDEYKGLLNAPR